MAANCPHYTPVPQAIVYIPHRQQNLPARPLLPFSCLGLNTNIYVYIKEVYREEGPALIIEEGAEIKTGYPAVNSKPRTECP